MGDYNAGFPISLHSSVNGLPTPDNENPRAQITSTSTITKHPSDKALQSLEKALLQPDAALKELEKFNESIQDKTKENLDDQASEIHSLRSRESVHLEDDDDEMLRRAQDTYGKGSGSELKSKEGILKSSLNKIKDLLSPKKHSSADDSFPHVRDLRKEGPKTQLGFTQSLPVEYSHESHSFSTPQLMTTLQRKGAVREKTKLGAQASSLAADETTKALSLDKNLSPASYEAFFKCQFRKDLLPEIRTRTDLREFLGTLVTDDGDQMTAHFVPFVIAVAELPNLSNEDFHAKVEEIKNKHLTTERDTINIDADTIHKFLDTLKGANRNEIQAGLENLLSKYMIADNFWIGEFRPKLELRMLGTSQNKITSGDRTSILANAHKQYSVMSTIEDLKSSKPSKIIDRINKDANFKATLVSQAGDEVSNIGGEAKLLIVAAALCKAGISEKDFNEQLGELRSLLNSGKLNLDAGHLQLFCGKIAGLTEPPIQLQSPEAGRSVQEQRQFKANQQKMVMNQAWNVQTEKIADVQIALQTLLGDFMDESGFWKDQLVPELEKIMK